MARSGDGTHDGHRSGWIAVGRHRGRGGTVEGLTAPATAPSRRASGGRFPLVVVGGLVAAAVVPRTLQGPGPHHHEGAGLRDGRAHLDGD